MRYTSIFLLLVTISLVVACSPSKGNRRGHEYMPDMVHSVGYEANLYDFYWFNRWGTKEEYAQYVMPRHSVPGTVARGEIAYADAGTMAEGMHAMDMFTGKNQGSMAIPANGSVPYYYGDSEAERARAMNDIRTNPFPITEDGLAAGKLLYEIYCGICHGLKGDGQGYLVRDEDPAKGIPAGVYPAAPANFMLDTFVVATPGRFYHAIMHGKNVMGSYADKLSYKERWEVIHYIRSLQAASKKLKYSADVNTFNQEATPWSVFAQSMKRDMSAPEEAASAVAETHSEGNQEHH